MALSGVRVGYLVADDHIMDVLYGCAVNVIGATNSTFQAAVAYAMDHPEFMTEGYYPIFEERRPARARDPQRNPGRQDPASAERVPDLGGRFRPGHGRGGRLLPHAGGKGLRQRGRPYGRQGAGHIRIVHGCFQDSQRIYRAMERVRAALIQLGREKGLAQ